MKTGNSLSKRHVNGSPVRMRFRGKDGKLHFQWFHCQIVPQGHIPSAGITVHQKVQQQLLILGVLGTNIFWVLDARAFQVQHLLYQTTWPRRLGLMTLWPLTFLPPIPITPDRRHLAKTTRSAPEARSSSSSSSTLYGTKHPLTPPTT